MSQSKMTTFERRHFALVAGILKETRPQGDNGAILQWHSMVRAFALTFGQVNPNFKRSRFYDACGVDPLEMARWGE